MGQTADQARQELDQKRHELTRDIDHIEDKVKETFDIARQVEQNPLLAAGLAVLGGFLIGSMTGGRGKHKDEHHHGSGSYPSAAYYAGSYTPSGGDYVQGSVYSPPSSQSNASCSSPQDEGQQHGSGGGLISGMTSGVKESFRRGSGGSTVEDTLSNVTAALTAIMVEKAKEMLDRNLPGFAEKYEQARQRASIEGSHQGYSEGVSASSPMDAEDGAARSGPSGADMGITASPYSSASSGEQRGSPASPTPRTVPQ